MIDYSKFKGHTPGPWKVIVNRVGIFIENQTQYGIADLSPVSGEDTPEQIANAALIAAAPDLLAENKRLRDLVRQMLDDIKTDMAHSVGDQYGNFPNGEPEFIDRLEWAKNASAIFNEQ